MTEELIQALTRLEAWMRQYMKSWYNEAEDIQQAIRMKGSIPCESADMPVNFPSISDLQEMTWFGRR